MRSHDGLLNDVLSSVNNGECIEMNEQNTELVARPRHKHTEEETCQADDLQCTK